MSSAREQGSAAVQFMRRANDRAKLKRIADVLEELIIDTMQHHDKLARALKQLHAEQPDPRKDVEL